MVSDTGKSPCQLPDSIQSQDIESLKELYTLYNENTEKLRLAFERLERRFQEIDPYNIYNSITEGLVTLDQEGNILTFNRAAEQIFSVQEPNVTSKAFIQCVPHCAEIFQNYLTTRSPENRYEISFRNEQGDLVFVRSRFSPLLDRNGVEIGTTCLFTDLSVERLLEEKARRQDRLTALGELAAGVAHEMRNPLTTIRGYLQILPVYKNDEEFIAEFSTNLIREIDRLTRLTDDLLNMTKPISPELQVEQISTIVTTVTGFMSDKLEGIELEIAEDTAGTPVLVDKDRIRQVFINLLMNAVEAMKSQGKIQIRFSQRVEKLSGEEDATTYAVAEVIDSGPGIPRAPAGAAV
jgi:PAS domain S-box-containing protein